MTANEKRKAVISLYKSILGRNYYSQARRNYCFKKYKDGKYYSDCSSSISYCYKNAGYSFGILNTVGMYQCKEMTSVPVTIKNGLIQNPELLRIGDMLLFAGTNAGRANAGYVGHVEMVYAINDSTVTLCGHGSGRPSTKNMNTYCKSRYASKTKNTKLGHKGLIKVVRFIQDDGDTDSLPVPLQGTSSVAGLDGAITITGGSVNIRNNPDTSHGVYKVAHKGDQFERMRTDGWIAILVSDKVRWISSKYVNANGVCTGNAVNIRSGAGTSFSSVGIAKKGNKLEMVNYDKWVPILIGKNVKWVSEKYIK